jgi:CBS domain-containing protein
MQRKLFPDVIKECRCTTFSPDGTVQAAAALMTQHNIGALVVVEKDDVIGIVTERDIMRKVVAAGIDPDKTPVRNIMTANPDVVTGDCFASKALEMMVSKGYRHLPIVTDDGKICSMVSVRDLYEAVQDSLKEDLVNVENYVLGGEGYGGG